MTEPQQLGGPIRSVRQYVQTARILCFGLAFGLLSISLVLLLVGFDFGAEAAAAADQGAAVGPDEEQTAAGEEMFTTIVAVAGPAIFFAAWIAAAMLVPMLRRQSAEQFRASGGSIPSDMDGDTALDTATGKLLGSFLTAALVGGALVEGAAVVNLMLAFFTGQRWLIGVALAGVPVIALQAPTVQRTLDRLQEIAWR